MANEAIENKEFLREVIFSIGIITYLPDITIEYSVIKQSKSYSASQAFIHGAAPLLILIINT